MCLRSTFVYNVILIAAKSFQNWQGDKFLAGNVLPLPYLALHITSNTEWHQSCISLCVLTSVHISPVEKTRPCQSVCSSTLNNSWNKYVVKCTMQTGNGKNLYSCFPSHASKFLYTFISSLFKTLPKAINNLSLKGPKSTTQKSGGTEQLKLQLVWRARQDKVD